MLWDERLQVLHSSKTMSKWRNGRFQCEIMQEIPVFFFAHSYTIFFSQTPSLSTLNLDKSEDLQASMLSFCKSSNKTQILKNKSKLCNRRNLRLVKLLLHSCLRCFDTARCHYLFSIGRRRGAAVSTADSPLSSNGHFFNHIHACEPEHWPGYNLVIRGIMKMIKRELLVEN